MHIYIKEFLTQRLILFLLFVIITSGIGTFLTFGSKWTLAALFSGIVLFIILEYTVHRYLMHEFPKLVPYIYNGHAAHHESPDNIKYLIGPVTFEIATYPVILLIAWLLTDYDWHLALATVFGTSVYQIYYQWKHYMSHRPIKPLTLWGRWVKKKHLLHHHMDENAWYGVSTPVFDILFGTNQSKSPNSNKGNSVSKINHRPPLT
ncbi:MAG TPA: sterol desaturase family protein [Bacillus bacterium]|nr:sterol desaturase family protein [Bacillus sp. (in: firmicutes)]